MWKLDYTESWVLKNWCFWTVVLEKTLESPLDCKEIQPVNPKGSQSWIFLGRTDVEAETPILWPPDAKSWLIWKDPDAGKDWRQEEKRMTEDEMAGWHHWLSGHGFGWTPGVGDGQGGLAYCSSWGRKESDTTEWLNWTELVKHVLFFILYVFIHIVPCYITSLGIFLIFANLFVPVWLLLTVVQYSKAWTHHKFYVLIKQWTSTLLSTLHYRKKRNPLLYEVSLNLCWDPL